MRIDKLQFEVSKSPLKPFIVPLKDSWPTDLKPKHYSYYVLTEIYGIELKNGEEGVAENIGFIESTFIDIVKIEHANDSVYNVFNAISEDMSSAYNTLTESNRFSSKFVGKHKNILSLETIHIKDEYSNVAKSVITNIDNILFHSLGLKIGCIIMIPLAFYVPKENDQTIIKSVNGHDIDTILRSYMYKLGYKEITDSDFLYINTDYR